jgi:AraC family transcriptional regulator, transcriptional activator of pobA
MSYEVLLLLGRQFRGARSLDASPVGSGLAFRFLMLVERRFRDVHRVADYARELGVTPGHLNLRVREALGRSAGAVVRDRLIVEARRLLHYSDRTVAQIAISLGFTDASYFTRFVRRETSSTPRALRPRPGAP